jgi:hypothetical protein
MPTKVQESKIASLYSLVKCGQKLRELKANLGWGFSPFPNEKKTIEETIHAIDWVLEEFSEVYK